MSRILIVVDMQNDFIDGSLGSHEAVTIVEPVRRMAASWDGPVVFTKDTHGADYMNTQEGRKLPVSHCIRGTKGWELEPGLNELCHAKNSLVFEKGTFGSRSLAEYLAALNAAEPIEEIVLAGLCTDICVISNAMLIKAFLPEVPVAVEASCCAGVTPESHERALLAMEMCQVEVRR